MGVAELGGEVHFANEPLAQEPIGDLRVEHLDRDAPMRVLFDGQVHPRHAPRPDFAFDVVVGREELPQ